MYQELFNHMSNEHDLILLETEMQEIISICVRTRNRIEIARQEENTKDESDDMCECGQLITKDEFEIFNGKCEECAIEEEDI